MRKIVYGLLVVVAVVLALSFSACETREAQVQMESGGFSGIEAAPDNAQPEQAQEEKTVAEESESSAEEEDTQDVEQAVHELMAAMQAGDQEAMRSRVDYTNLLQLESGQSNVNLMAILQHMQYEILNASKDSSNTATVQVSITNVDMHKVLSDYFQQANALYYNNALSESPLPESELEQQVEALFEQALDDHQTDTASRVVDLTLHVENGEWKVQSTEDFRTAAFGDFWNARDAVGTMG